MWSTHFRASAQSEKQEYAALQGVDSDSVSTEGDTFYARRKSSLLLKLFSIASLALSCAWAGWSLNSFIRPHSHFNPIGHPGVPNHITDPVISQVFMVDPLYKLENTDKAAEDAWLAYDSRFVQIQDPEQYGLAPSTQYEEGGPHAYSLAAYHQLHCLAVVRFAWHTLLYNGSAALENPFPGNARFSEGYTIGSHMSHCVEIIRHALTCYADATLEPLLSEDGLHHSNVLASGWGVRHTCRDLNLLTHWADTKEARVTIEGDVSS